MKKLTLLFAMYCLVCSGLLAQTPTASVARVQIYYCQPETVNVSETIKTPQYEWGGMTLTESGEYQHTFINRLGCDSVVNLTLTIEKPAFSVSSTTKIVFAPGNLQWCADDGTHVTHKDQAGHDQDGIFRFAAHQWEMIGANSDANKYSDQCHANSWTDLLVVGNLFDKSTTGAAIDTYKPYPNSFNSQSSSWANNTRRSASIYYNGITLTAKEDWGYHEIQNGNTVDAPGTWRSITSTEMTYLLSTRTNAENLRGFAKVNDVKGFILLPDECDLSSTGLTFTSYATLTNVGESWNDPSLNVYSEVQWQQLEALGAVFLPLAGKCTDHYNSYGNYQSSGNTAETAQGYYWTFPSSKQVLFFDFGSMKIGDYGNIDDRCAVRLVKNAN